MRLDRALFGHSWGFSTLTHTQNPIGDLSPFRTIQIPSFVRSQHLCFFHQNHPIFWMRGQRGILHCCHHGVLRPSLAFGPPFAVAAAGCGCGGLQCGNQRGEHHEIWGVGAGTVQRFQVWVKYGCRFFKHDVQVELQDGSRRSLKFCNEILEPIDLKNSSADFGVSLNITCHGCPNVDASQWVCFNFYSHPG